MSSLALAMTTDRCPPIKVEVTEASSKGEPYLLIFLSLPKDIFHRFLERKGEKKREKHQCEREALIGCLPYAPRPEIKPQTQLCGLTRN